MKKSIKWADYTEEDWQDEYPSEETPEPVAGSDDSPDDEEYSIPGEDEMLEGCGLLHVPYVYRMVRCFYSFYAFIFFHSTVLCYILNKLIKNHSLPIRERNCGGHSPSVSWYVTTRTVSGWLGTSLCAKICWLQQSLHTAMCHGGFVVRKNCEILETAPICRTVRHWRPTCCTSGVNQACTTCPWSSQQGTELPCAPDFKNLRSCTVHKLSM